MGSSIKSTALRGARQRRGFTAIELMIVVVILCVLAAVGFPRVSREIRRSRANEASAVVAADVEVAFSLAGRQRRPVTLSYVSASKELQIADRATTAIVRRRPLGTETEWKIDRVTAFGLPVTIFPSGVASGAFTIDLTSGSSTRRVSSTRVGLTRVFTP
jgi:prepilin-type N-terminal cleavage/methylation domain-containing protein